MKIPKGWQFMGFKNDARRSVYWKVGTKIGAVENLQRRKSHMYDLYSEGQYIKTISLTDLP